MARLSDADRNAAMFMYATTGNARDVAKTYDVSAAVIYKSWERLPQSKKKEFKDQNALIIEDVISVAEASYIADNAGKLYDFYKKIADTKLAILDKIQSQISLVDDSEFRVLTLNALVNAFTQISEVTGGDADSSLSNDNDFINNIINNSVINYGQK